MSKVTIFNDGKCALPVNGILLAIGSQVILDRADLTPGLKKFVLDEPEQGEVVEDSVTHSLVEEIQSLSISKAKERFGELSPDQLDELQALELDQDNPRAGLTDAITVELLNRSNTDTETVAADSESESDATGGDDE